MTTTTATVEQILTLAQKLKLQEQAQLIAELAVAIEKAIRKSEDQPLAPRPSLHGALAHLGPAPSAEDIDEVRREMWEDTRQARELAQLTAPIEEAWRKSSLTEEDLPAILEQIRIEVARRDFPDLFTDE